MSVFEDEAGRARWLAIVRSAASEPAAAAVLRILVEHRLRDPLAHALPGANPELRAALIGAQIVGLAMSRYVVGVEPLASLPPEDVAAAIAPTMQLYLLEPFDLPA